ncbi:SHOCT domain-containing protein [Novosphingobium sp. TH158]|uniref:SHOCT domain-containing protein n=1 Tax=Novosphingobium sp. TH158 TaxID=2067455 RepID=UPI000C79DA7B|nr:SHOCT domain-containing protein [Novosphingobium sp. TH158]PLK25625.1 hypothetical protein C0V78_00985 [Novosphingobium sp. TH158]
MANRLEALERLQALHASGALTKQEFEAEKQRLLSGAEDAGGSTNWGLIAGIGIPAALVVALGGWWYASQLGEKADAALAEASASASASAEASEAASAAPSAAADPYAGAELVQCRQGECSWEKVLSVRTIQTTADGELKITESYVGSSRDDGTGTGAYSPKLAISWEKPVVQTYVFCSLKQPGLAFKDRWGEGGWIGHLIDPYDTYGYNTSSVRTYMKACHGLDFYRKDITKVLQRIGYRPGTRNEQVELASPKDLSIVPFE